MREQKFSQFKEPTRSVKTQNPDPNHPVTSCLPRWCLPQWRAEKVERKGMIFAGVMNFSRQRSWWLQRGFWIQSPEIITSKTQKGKSNITTLVYHVSFQDNPKLPVSYPKMLLPCWYIQTANPSSAECDLIGVSHYPRAKGPLPQS